MPELFQKIIESVQRGQNVALATVIARKGSLPMSKQARMLVFPDGSILGTVGGGLLEAQVIREAQQVLLRETPKIVAVELTSAQIEAEGLTCGGVVEIFIEPFMSAAQLPVMAAITDIAARSQAAVMATRLDAPLAQDSGQPQPASAVNRKIVIAADGTMAGTFGVPEVDDQIKQFALTRIDQEYQEIFTPALSAQAAQQLGLLPDTPFRVFLETVLPAPTAYLFGGGHIAFHLANVLRLIGFEFVVIDDRPEFANSTRFPDAKECIAGDFAQVFEQLALHPPCAYLIIVTRGHRSDLLVLEQALRTQAKYIGMIGSKRKIALLFQHLREKGVAPAALAAVHAPIGLPIGADTPEEIAVSIAAELIQVRRG